MISLILIFASFVTLTLGLYAFKKREESSSLPFAALMFAATLHTLGYAFELLATDKLTAIMWLNIEYAGIAFLPVILLWFSYANVNEDRLFDKLVMLFYFTVSLTTFFLVQTNGTHYFYYKEIIFVAENTLSLVRGPWFYVQSVSVVTSMIIMIINTLKMYKNSVLYYRTRAISILLSVSIPLILCILVAFDVPPKNIDIFPFMYVLMGVIWFIDFLKFGMFDIMPVTYKKVFENISEGVVVLDNNDYLVNFNLAAYDVFKTEVKLLIGLDIKTILELIVPLNNSDYTGQIFEIRSRNKMKIYHLKSTELYDNHENYKGRIMVFNNVTKEIEASRILQSLATKDALTGLSNRRHFFDRCRAKIEQARLEGIRISFVMMDLDHFKLVNDTYGHAVGDDILKEVSHLCDDMLRPSDIMGRYGGEEFTILLYDTSLSETHLIIERMRDKISNHQFISDLNTIRLTVSFGVYRPNLLEEDDMSSILKKADKSLYQAKNEGRDRVVVYSDYAKIR